MFTGKDNENYCTLPLGIYEFLALKIWYLCDNNIIFSFFKLN